MIWSSVDFDNRRRLLAADPIVLLDDIERTALVVDRDLRDRQPPAPRSTARPNGCTVGREG
jgi:hypothetical protein